MTKSRNLFTVALFVSACNVETSSTPTKGVVLDEGGRAERCERGLAVVTSDYRSTNVAIAKLDGTTVEESFVSSGSAKPGLAMALSGDVVVPRSAPLSGNLVLLDRFGTNVITWMDLESGAVLDQLPVGTGFESNPQDYLEYDDNRAVISRYGNNPNPGKHDFDEGGDLLLLETTPPRISGRIAMPENDPTLLPRPSGMNLVGDTVVVTLARLSADFTTVGEGRFVGVSLEIGEIAWTVDIPGLTNCGRLAKSPSGNIGAIACSSKIDTTTYRYDPTKSDVVLFDLGVTPPVELRRLQLARALETGLQPTLEFASETKLLVATFGGNSTPGDRLVAVDTETGSFEALLDTEGPYVLGGIHCSPGCGDVCIVSDAESGKLRRFSVSNAGEISALSDAAVDDVIGLPPRALGGL